MPQRVRQIDCDGCAFLVQSESEDEIVEMTRLHARNVHDMRMSGEDIRRMMTEP